MFCQEIQFVIDFISCKTYLLIYHIKTQLEVILKPTNIIRSYCNFFNPNLLKNKLQNNYNSILIKIIKPNNKILT